MDGNELLRLLTAPRDRAGEAQEVTVAETRDGIWDGDSWWPLGSASSVLTRVLTCPQGPPGQHMGQAGRPLTSQSGLRESGRSIHSVPRGLMSSCAG